MRLTHSINSTTFSELSSSALRQSLGCFADKEDYQVSIFHPPGTAGNVTVWAGRQGQSINSTQRYVGTAAAVLSAYKTDREAWASGPVTILDSEGTSFLRCRLIKMSVTKPCQPCGANICKMEVDSTFNRDS